MVMMMRWCSANGISPDEVDDTVAAAVVDALMAKGNRACRATALRHVRGYWNQAVERVPGWPQRRITLGLTAPPRLGLPESAFPASFLADLNAFCARAVQGATAAETARERRDRLKVERAAGRDAQSPPDGRRKAVLRQTSVAGLRRFVLELASTLVRTGERRVETITRVADVATEDAINVHYDDFCGRRPDTPERATTIHTMCNAMGMLAVRLDPHARTNQPELFETLNWMRAQNPMEPGMKRRNAARLRQFRTPDVITALHDLPHRLFEELEKKRRRGGGRGKGVSLRDAQTAQQAIAVMLLNIVPERIHSLALIDIDRNIVWPTKRNQPGELVFAPHENKTGRERAVELPPWAIAYLCLFIQEYRPRLLRQGSTTRRLFLNQSGAEIRPATMASQVSRLVRSKAGLEVSPHLWRHLSKKVLLDADPRNEAVAESLAGRTFGSRAAASYGSINAAQAAAVLEQVVEANRTRARTARAGGRRAS